MKKILLLLLFVSFNIYSQERNNIDLLYKTWKLVTLEKNNSIKTAQELEMNESITFHKNRKFKIIDTNSETYGVWSFNPFTNYLELKLLEFNTTLKFKIISLSSNELSYIYEELDKNMIYHLTPTP